MKTNDLTQLANALMADALQAQDPVELFHALERLEKGATAIHKLAQAANELAEYKSYAKE